MRSIAIMVFILALLAAGSGRGLAQSEKVTGDPRDDIGSVLVGDGIVVPGERIGPVLLGMPLTKMLQVMPAAYRRYAFEKENVIVFEWRREGVWVSLDAQTKQVRLISAFGTAAYKTDKGVTLLQTQSKMEDAYGKTYKRYDYPDDRLTLVRYVPLGVQFGIVNYPSQKMIHGRIFTIGIFTPGKEPPLTKPAK